MFEAHLELSELNSRLRTHLLGKAPGWNNEVWESIDSTNIRACDLAKNGAPEGVIICARQQTAGKGRLGRTWVSPQDAGLYVSFILRPQLSANEITLLSFAAGLAVAEAINDQCGIEPGLKWVNDVVYGGKKLAGILCEMVLAAGKGGESPAVVAGIGINIRRPAEGLPDEVAAIAVYLEEITQSAVDANGLAAALAEKLEKRYQQLSISGGASVLIKDWRKRAVTLGKRVKVVSGTTQFEAVAKDISDNGLLIVETDDGALVSLNAGDVSVRNTDGSYY